MRAGISRLIRLLEDIFIKREAPENDKQTALPECQCSQNHPCHVPEDPITNRILQVRFVWRGYAKAWGSAILRSHQLAQMLGLFDSKINAKSVSIAALGAAGEPVDVVVLHKTALEFRFLDRVLKRLKREGATIILDLVDGDPRKSKWVEPQIDAYMCASHSEFSYRRQRGQKATFVAHQLNSMFKQTPPEQTSFKVGYVGSPLNALHLHELSIPSRTPGFSLQPEERDDLLSFLTSLTHHYSVRNYLPNDGFKPGLKIYMAAHFGATFIGSRDDPESLALLGHDYPYLSADSSLDEVKKTIALAQKSFGGELHQIARQRLDNLRSEFCSARVMGVLQQMIWKVSENNLQR